MKLYGNDEHGNIIEGQSDTGFFGEAVYNPRVWAEKHPGEAPAGKLFILDGIIPEWQLVDDVRGIWYDTQSGEEIEIKDPRTRPDGLTRLKPGRFDTWNGQEWVLNIELQKAAEEAELRAADEREIFEEMRAIAIERIMARK